MTELKSIESKQSSSQPRKKRFGKQPTHFLCFPLVSDDILQPFGSSLEYFRNMTTIPPREHPLKVRQRKEREWKQQLECQEEIKPEDGTNVDDTEPSTKRPMMKDTESQTPESDPFGKTSKATGDTFEESLKIIPAISHRPLGTYHLTIGVLDLAEPQEYQKYEEIFKTLNLKELLREAEKGPPIGSKVARRWKHDSRYLPNEPKSTKEIDPHPSDAQPTDSKLDVTVNASSTDPTPIQVSLLGLGAFNSPRGARVLYAHPVEQTPKISLMSSSKAPSQSANTHSTSSYDLPFPDRLYNFALHIEAPFRAAGLIKETRPLTLHATLVNIRHKVQPKGGRTSKGKAWTYGRKRWDENCVDASLLCRIFNEYSGDVETAKTQLGSDSVEEQDEDEDEDENPQSRSGNEANSKQDSRDKDEADHNKQFLWAKDVPINRVALCELGAKKSNDEQLGMEYPLILEKWI